MLSSAIVKQRQPGTVTADHFHSGNRGVWQCARGGGVGAPMGAGVGAPMGAGVGAVRQLCSWEEPSLPSPGALLSCSIPLDTYTTTSRTLFFLQILYLCLLPSAHWNESSSPFNAGSVTCRGYFCSLLLPGHPG